MATKTGAKGAKKSVRGKKLGEQAPDNTKPRLNRPKAKKKKSSPAQKKPKRPVVLGEQAPDNTKPR